MLNILVLTIYLISLKLTQNTTLVITGTPGVGKHTIAKNLSHRWNYKIIDINKIILQSKIYEENNLEHTLDVDVSLLAKLLQKKSFDKSIIVGHLAPYVLDPNKIDKMIIIRRNPYELISIYQRRKYISKKIFDNLGAEILGVITYDSITKFGPKKICQIINSGKIDQIIKKIVKCSKGKMKINNIDWLSLIIKNKDLGKFFVG